MNKALEDRTIQAMASVGSLAGLSLKKVSIGDDLKDYTLTLAFTGVSAGLVQERFDFDREDTRVVATVNGRGEVLDLKVSDLDPSDLTEKDETQAKAVDPDDETEKLGAATEEPRKGHEVAVGEVAELAPDAPKPDIHLVGEASAMARKRR